MDNQPISKTYASMWNVNPKTWGKDISNNWFYGDAPIKTWYDRARHRQLELMTELRNIQYTAPRHQTERQQIIMQSHKIELQNINDFLKFCERKGYS